MEIYVVAVGLLRFCVAFLLLIASGCICGSFWSPARLLLGALLGGCYAGVCLSVGNYFLGNSIFYFLVLITIGFVAFGKQSQALCEICVFVIMNLLLDMVMAERKTIVQGFVVILSAVIIVMFYFKGGKGGLVPVQLKHQGKTMTLMALRDTGNMLRDPVSGKPVLVVSPDVAQDLLGLTHEQLRKPIESIGALPGLRLIPYKTIGQHGAMMLGMRLQEVRIGLRKGNGLVAFAPERIGSGGAYKALTGG